MTSSKSVLHAVGLAMSGAGILACAVAATVVWVATVRAGRITDGLFGRIDRALAVVQQRVVQTAEVLAAATIGTEELEETLRDGIRRGVESRPPWLPRIEEQAGRLTLSLQQADQWLETAESSVGLIQGVLWAGASTSMPADTTRVDRLMDTLASLRSQLAEATGRVAGIQERISEAGVEKAREERIGQAEDLAVRVVAALGSIDSSLAKLTAAIAATQFDLQEMKTGMRRWILTMAIAGTLLIVWMGAGQVAWFRHAWSARSDRLERRTA